MRSKQMNAALPTPVYSEAVWVWAEPVSLTVDQGSSSCMASNCTCLEGYQAPVFCTAAVLVYMLDFGMNSE